MSKQLIKKYMRVRKGTSSSVNFRIYMTYKFLIRFKPGFKRKRSRASVEKIFLIKDEME